LRRHAEQTNYDPAKVSDSLKAIFQFGSVSTKNALNANTVTLLTGTIGGTYCAGSVPTSLPCSTTTVICASCRSSVEVRLQSVADILFLKGVDLGIVRADTLDYLEKKGFANDIKRHSPIDQALQ